MSKRVWVYPRDGGEAFEVFNHLMPRDPVRYDGVLWNDRQYQDCGDPRFASRTQHREYLRANGLTIDSDFKGQWEKDAQRRADLFQGRQPGDPESVRRAFEQVQQGYKPQRIREE